MNYYQQGDVLLKRVERLPDGLKELKSKILQLGEVTGHKHQFAKDDVVTVYIDPANVQHDTRITPDEGKYIVVGNTAYLTHEEHKPVQVEPGVYQVDIVREFDYDAMEARRVVD